MSPGQERARVIVAGFVGAGVSAICAVIEWDSAPETGYADFASPSSQVGTDLAPWALPCALVAGAAFLALLVTGRRVRRIVGALAALAGLAVVLAGALHLVHGAGPIGMAIAGLVVAAAGVAATVGSGRWPEPSTRYDAKPVDGEDVAADPTKLWNALDSGQDPSSPTISESAQEKGRS